MPATVEAAFVLRSDATVQLERMEAQAGRTQASFERLGLGMDASATRGTRALDGSAAAATRSAAVHETAARRTERAWYASGSSLVRMGRGVTLGFVGAGLAALDFATKFQTATTQFNTQAGASVAQTERLKKGILDMAVSVGATPLQIAGGMYHVVSSMDKLVPAAQRVGVELATVREAAKGAAIGGSNVTETTYALSSAMTALGRLGIRDATRTMAELNAIVGTGDMHMQDLVGAMSTGILPAARTFHVSLTSVGAALAYMTDRGVPAQQAATRLRMAISLLGAPTKQSAGILKDLGLSYSEVQMRENGLSTALQKSGVTMTELNDDLRKPDGMIVALRDLKSHMEAAGISTKAQADIIVRAFGGGRQSGSILALFNDLRGGTETYNREIRAANDYSGDWTRTTHTLGFQLHQAEAGVQVLAVRLGTALIPWVEKGITEGEKFARWLEHNKTAAEALAITIGTVLTAAVAAFALNSVARLARVTRDFFNLGRTVANLPMRISRGIGNLYNAPSAAAEAERTAGASGVMGGGWGVRSMGPGSELNPLVVMVAGTGLGRGGVIPAAEGTVARDAQAIREGVPISETAPAAARSGGIFSTVARGGRAALSGGLSAVGRLAGGATAGGIAFLATQALGQMIPGPVGHTIGSLGVGAGVGAGLLSILGGPATLGAIVGMAAQYVGQHPSWVAAATRGGTQLGVPGFHPPSLGLGGGSMLPGVASNPVGFITGLIGGMTSSTPPDDREMIARIVKKTRSDLSRHLWSAAASDAVAMSRVLGSPAQQLAIARAQMPPGMSKADQQQYLGGGIHDTSRVWIAAGRVAQIAAAGEGQAAAKSWTDAFMKGVSGQDPTTAKGQAAVADKTKMLASGVKTELDKLTPTGRLALATAMDAWAAQMEQKNPKIKGQMDTLQAGITQDMHDLHQHIVDVQGHVLTDSQQQWKQIASAITNPVDAAQAHLAGTFGTIWQEALGALEAMGYTRSAASGILTAMQGGQGFSQKGLHAGTANVTGGVSAPGAATGARVPGAITGDTWSLVDPGGVPRGFVGGGELLIANRHTEAAASAATMAAYGKTLGEMVTGEHRSHMAPGYASGGIFSGVGAHAHGAGTAGVTGGGNFPGLAPGLASMLMNSPLMKAVAQLLGSIGNISMSMLGGMGAGGGGGAAGPIATGSPQQARVTAMVRQLAGRYGWGSPGEINAWLGIISRESGFNPTIANPSTTAAYGLGQFFNAAPGNPVLPRGEQLARNFQKYRDYGGDPNSVMGQLVGMANYIKQNWGDPINAGIHEQSSTYATGGYVHTPIGGASTAAGGGWRGFGWDPRAVPGYRAFPHPDPNVVGSMAWARLHGLGPNEHNMPGVPRGPRQADRPGVASLAGHGARWGGWHAAGGTFHFDRPTVIGVGERGRESVQVGPPRVRAGRVAGTTIEVSIGTIQYNRDGDLKAAIERELVALAEEMRQERDTVPLHDELELLA